MTLKGDFEEKLEEKLTCDLENDMRIDLLFQN